MQSLHTNTNKESNMKEILGGVFLGLCFSVPMILWAFGFLG